ncbi:hypothetical protein LOC68_08625 [Blastopirellula sp. JC732]|uniref:Carboxypeptidase regulatory-like domain-containing protein n=1 Tax=Blastopirellula sediminis TaxID=2894196 RepID=A0A9X1MLD5_9BACT|nr:hypothetical protein [Blastopirellula sediminis]MCC9608766.1 hypothetical protein [Blastopirellula sediminis]MCC9628457.1 hypothetical protein [Blastopirellula sediminis]
MIGIRSIHAALLSGCAAAALLVSAGCGPRLDPNKVPVQVQINYKGGPIAEAVVIFVSDDGQYANGLTGSDGVARMGTSAPGDGVFPGQYKVAVDKSQLIEESDPNDPTGMRILRSQAVYHVPARYSDFMKSGLTVDVSKEGPSDFVFDLVDK